MFLANKGGARRGAFSINTYTHAHTHTQYDGTDNSPASHSHMHMQTHLSACTHTLRGGKVEMRSGVPPPSTEKL